MNFRKTVILHIVGMRCGGCAATVGAALKAVSGVVGVNVSLDDATATVEFDPAVVTEEALKASVAAAGYQTS